MERMSDLCQRVFLLNVPNTYDKSLYFSSILSLDHIEKNEKKKKKERKMRIDRCLESTRPKLP